MDGGDCLTCYRLSSCLETSIARVLTSYVCPLYGPVPEALYRARMDMIEQFGEGMAIRAMLNRGPEQQGEETDGNAGT